MTRVLLDVDGVLGDMLESALKIINELNGFVTPAETITDWAFTKSLKNSKHVDAFWDAMGAPGFCRTIRPYPKAQQAVKRILAESPRHEIYVVTSYVRSSPTWVYDRNKWLEKHFQIKRENIVHVAKKHVVSGDIFVDDKIENITDWAKHNRQGIAVLWDQPYNQHLSPAYLSNIRRMNDWDELLNLIEEVHLD